MGTAFASTLLQRLTGAYSIKIDTRDHAEAPWHRTTVWVAVDQATGAVYVRSVRGPRGNWYRRLLANPQGSVAGRGQRGGVKAGAGAGGEGTPPSGPFSRQAPKQPHPLPPQPPAGPP